MLENTEHNVNHNYISYHWQIKLDHIAGGLLARTEPIFVQEKYIIRVVKTLLCLGGNRSESCKKVHIIN